MYEEITIEFDHHHHHHYTMCLTANILYSIVDF